MGEAMMIAKKSDIDLDMFWNSIRFSAGNSFVWETETPLVMNGEYNPGFTVNLQCKDMELGHFIAKQYEIPIEIFSLVQQIYNRAKYKYGDESGSSIIPKLLEHDLNESLQIDGFKKWEYSVDINDDSTKVLHKNIEK